MNIRDTKEKVLSFLSRQTVAAKAFFGKMIAAGKSRFCKAENCACDAPGNDPKEQEKYHSKGAVDFYPDALEIKYQQLPWFAQRGVTWALVFMVVAVIWASVSKVDVIVVGQGKLVSDRDIVMKPLERSVIKSIEVHPGDVVKKDQVLIYFDPELTMADVERLSADLNTYTALFERLKAEFYGTEYNPQFKPTDKGAKDMTLQRAIFVQRTRYYNERIRYYDEYLNRLDASVKATSDSMHKQEEILKAMQDIEGIYNSLHEKKITSLKERLQIAINRMESESTLDKLRNSLVEQSHQRQTILSEKKSFMEEWRNTLSEKLVDARQNLNTTEKQYNKAAQMMSYIQLRAPCDAVVLDVASFSVGSAVREAEAVITLVPLDSAIEMEAEIRPMDIGKIRPGSEARVKLSAFPFQKHGTLLGTVRTISGNTFSKQSGEGGGGAGAGSYYKARLSLSGKLHNLDNQKKFLMIPGMEATAEIKTGTRRIIEFVTYPLIRGLDESFHEP